MLGVNHSQDPYFAGAVGHGVLVLELVKLVVYVFVKGIVFRFLGPLLVFSGGYKLATNRYPHLFLLVYATLCLLVESLTVVLNDPDLSHWK